VRLTQTAETVSRVTGLGDLRTGALLIGLITSLSGLVTSVSAAASGYASLAVSNALGGIAAQTMFLAVADLVYRKANLEHVAASESNILQAVVLLVLLSIPVLALGLPGLNVAGIHPVSLLLIGAYLFGLRLVEKGQKEPMWIPRRTGEARISEGPDPEPEGPARGLWPRFAAQAAVVAVAGWVLARAAAQLTQNAGIGESIAGGVLTAVTTSLPELVVAVTAVRRGALALALGDILGGNAFDVLFLAASDIAYRDGSVYAHLGPKDIFWLGLSLIMVGMLVLGLLRRERYGVANIGFESSAVLLLYFGGVAVLLLTA